MKTILLFTVLLCSNALASPVDVPPSKNPRLTSPPSTDRSALATTSSLTGPPSTKPRLPSPVDEFLQICQPHSYLACWKYALLLKESTGEFARKNLLEEALQRAVKEENGWAVSALSDVVGLRGTEKWGKDENFYFNILDNYLNERESNQDLITLDVLRRKCIEMNPERAWGYRTTNPGRLILSESSVTAAAIRDAIKRSYHEQVYTLIRAFEPYELRKARILSYACQYGDQFAVFYATKDLVMGRKQEERPHWDEGERRRLEEKNFSNEEKSSGLHDAYKQARSVGNEDAVEFFQQFRGIHKGRWEKFKHFCTTWMWPRPWEWLGGLTPSDTSDSELNRYHR